MNQEHEVVEHAVNMLDQAVQSLVGPRISYFDGKVRTRAGRYQEVRDSLAGQQGAHGSHARSMPPIWIDAADWLKSVDRTVRGWAEGENTPHRLGVLVELNWRPQDLDILTDYTKALLTWGNRADELLEPKRRWDVLAPCPACGQSKAYRRDESGENVKTPALSVTTAGCECLVCHAKWGPELFAFLAKTIGCAAPAGVVE